MKRVGLAASRERGREGEAGDARSPHETPWLHGAREMGSRARAGSGVTAGSRRIAHTVLSATQPPELDVHPLYGMPPPLEPPLAPFAKQSHVACGHEQLMVYEFPSLHVSLILKPQEPLPPLPPPPAGLQTIVEGPSSKAIASKTGLASTASTPELLPEPLPDPLPEPLPEPPPDPPPDEPPLDPPLGPGEPPGVSMAVFPPHAKAAMTTRTRKAPRERPHRRTTAG